MRPKSGLILLLACCSSISAQAPRRAVLIDLDGVRRDTFVEAYRAGQLPNFARIFGEAIWFDNARSVVPSVTMAAQASIVTGTSPARHGIVGNQWFERDGSRFYDYMNANGITCVYGFTVLAGEGCLTGLGNRHLRVPTIHEAASAAGLTSLAVYHQYWKGSVRAAAPTMAEATSIVRAMAVDYRAFDRQMAARTVQDLKARGLPSILTVYFAGADGLSHKEGIAVQTPYLTGHIDPLLGSILEAIESLDPDWRGSTLFILTSDHGRTDVSADAGGQHLLAELKTALPPRAQVAVNGGLAYVYLERADAVSAESVRAALAADANLGRAIASVRLCGAGDSHRMGDLVVTLRKGRYFGSRGTGSEHGSVYDDDTVVPLVVAMPGIAGRRVNDAVSITQIARTIADFLGFDMDGADPGLPVRQRVRSPLGQ